MNAFLADRKNCGCLNGILSGFTILVLYLIINTQLILAKRDITKYFREKCFCHE